MASKIRPKSPDAPAQPPARVDAPAAPHPSQPEAVEAAAPSVVPAAVEPEPTQPEVIAAVMVPTPASVLARRAYEATYGQRIEDLRMRHGLARASECGAHFADLSHAGKLKIEVREDVLYPLLIDGVRTTVDQAVTLLIERDEAELGEKLIADLKRYRADKVSRAIIFSFAARHLELLEQAERAAAQPPIVDVQRDPQSSWAESGAPVPEEV